jgi:trk system potassium uptake protein TrkA
MRIVFIGAGSLTLKTATLLIKRGHEVVIIERNKEIIDRITNSMDCGLIYGDGTIPAVLREVDPEHCDMLICLAGNDQANIIAGLVGRSLGFNKVVTKVEDEEFEHICIELGLENTIVPVRTTSRYLADIVEGQDILEISAMIKGEARTFSFVVKEGEEGRQENLKLPAKTRMICLYRDGEFIMVDENTTTRQDDEVVLITQSDVIPILHEWLHKRERHAMTHNAENGKTPIE